MSSKEHADRLAHALNSLQFVETVNADFGNAHVQLLCRVQRGAEVKWAQVVEGILLAAESVHGQEKYWVTHICRLYFLREGKMLYGWHVGITSNFMEESLGEIVRSFASQRPAAQMRAVPNIPPTQPSPRRVVGVIEADAKGNPKVPPSHRVEVVPMAGLDPDLDRNYPNDDGTGVYGLYGSKKLGNPFRPPGGGGRVGDGKGRW